MSFSERSTLLNAMPENGSLPHEGSPPQHSNHSRSYVSLTGVALLIVSVLAISNWQASNSTVASGDMDRNALDHFLHEWEAALYQTAAKVVTGSYSDHILPAEEGELIYFNHSKAFQLMKQTDPIYTQDFYEYQQGWEAQINQAYCGVASSMAVLNSLRGQIQLPQDPVYVPFPWATQNILIRNECFRKTYDIDAIEGQFWGLTLDMATELLNCHLAGQGFVATAHHTDPETTTVNEIRTAFLMALRDPTMRLFINYDRGGITQGPMGHGHFSPIGAYCASQDAFLIMDVAKYKFPPVWVPTYKLVGGIASVDLCSNFTYPHHPVQRFGPDFDAQAFSQEIGCQPLSRGYVIVGPEPFEN